MAFPYLARLSSRISFSRQPLQLAIACAVALAAVCSAAVAQTAPQPTYTVTDLGTFDAYAINISGDLAGVIPNAGAAILKQGNVIDLGTIPNSEGVLPVSINGSDQVTGYADFPSHNDPYNPITTHAVLYSGGTLTDLGTLPGYDSTSGTAINDSGWIAGSYSNGSADYSTVPVPALMYRDGMFTAIPGFNHPLNTFAQNINASGQIAGSAELNGALHAAVSNNGSIQFLAAPPGETESEAVSINDSGWTTGDFYTSDGLEHAFLSINGKTMNIGTLPGGNGAGSDRINASGQIIGVATYFDDQGGGQIGCFLYTPGSGMVNLDSLLPKSSGLSYFCAQDINDKGQIIGTAQDLSGNYHNILLSPVFTPFSSLNAYLQLNGTPATTFLAAGQLTLGSATQGVNPLTQTTVLQLNGYHISIPPSSFTYQNGNYIFDGKIGNVTLGMVLRQQSPNTYIFVIDGIGAAALPTAYPVQLTLTIGTDTGAQQIAANYNGPPLTYADLCEYFDLYCTAGK